MSPPGEPSAAFDLLATMEARGVFPNVATFTALITACGAAGDTQRALGALRRTDAPGLSLHLR